jgi:sugar phosphate isomerase/epimerase
MSNRFEIACHTWTFADLTGVEVLGTIARAGFRAVDIGSGSAFNAQKAASHPRQAAAELRQDLHTFRLALTDLYLTLPRLALPGDGRAQDLALFGELLAFARALDVPGITVSAGVLPPRLNSMAAPIDDAFEDEAETPQAETPFQLSIAALRQMYAQAHAAGIALSIEPHIGSVVHDAETARQALDAVPGLLLTLDWAEMICQNIGFEALAPLLPHTRHMHIRQAARGSIQVPLEKGRLDFTRVLRESQAAGYSGALCIELLHRANRHGAARLQPLSESARLRDALRDARTSVLATAS